MIRFAHYEHRASLGHNKSKLLSRRSFLRRLEPSVLAQPRSKIHPTHGRLNFSGRGARARTEGLVVPNHARYQLRHTPKIKSEYRRNRRIPQVLSRSRLDLKVPFSALVISVCIDNSLGESITSRHIHGVMIKSFSNPPHHTFWSHANLICKRSF